MKLFKNKGIVFLLSFAPFLLWTFLSLTVMKPFVPNKIWVVVVMFLGLLLSICTIMDQLGAKVVSSMVLLFITIYLVFEGMNNSKLGFETYVVFLVLMWFYYLVLNFVNVKKK